MNNLLRSFACLAPLVLTVAVWAGDDPPVRVVLDMDAATPGIQSSITITACTEIVADVAVYVFDPLGTRTFYWIGYAGGVDRGLAFGHVPDNDDAGVVVSLQGETGPPLNPGNVNWLWSGPVDPAFSGPEVQYIEGSSPTAAVIPATAGAPIFTVDVTLDGTLPGDVFDFYLADFCAIWPPFAGPNIGAFSTQSPSTTLDAGGDVVPDQTNTIYGIDADEAEASSTFFVDIIDGPPGGGPAVIEVIAVAADVNEDGDVGVDDLVIVITEWGRPGGIGDVNDDGAVDVNDVVAVISGWGGCG